MDKTIYLLLGVALTWAFYFLQRRVERRRTTDAIERHQKLLALKQGLEGPAPARRPAPVREPADRQAETAVPIADGCVARAEQVRATSRSRRSATMTRTSRPSSRSGASTRAWTSGSRTCAGNSMATASPRSRPRTRHGWGSASAMHALSRSRTRPVRSGR
jgi:hypothetical protein